MNAVLDFAPALIFLGTYVATDIYTATIALIVSLFALVAVYWFRERRVHKSHLITALVAGVLGGMTLYFRNPAFIIYKPSAVYAIFALALLASHFIGDRVLLARIPQKTFQLPDPVWRKVNMAWVVFFLFCAVLNIYVAHNFSEPTWVKFKTFGFTLLMFVFMIGHLPFLKAYLPKES